jgi:hypothetical protein
MPRLLTKLFLAGWLMGPIGPPAITLAVAHAGEGRTSHKPWFGSHWFGFGEAWFGSGAFGRFQVRAPHHGSKVRRQVTQPRQLEPKSKAAAELDTIGQSTTGLSPTSTSRTMQDQVAAAIEVAERMTVAALTASSDNVGPTPLVAVVMAHPEIKSIADLADKTVGMDDRFSPFSVDVWTAFVAAGTKSIEVSAGHTAAIDRLSHGEVPASVLALVSPDAAEGFPEIAGFRIFRIPLLSSSSKARP